MFLTRSSFVRAVCVSFALVGTVSVAATFLATDSAYAKNTKNNGQGNNGNGNGHGNGNSGKSNGNLSSALGALNAAHASANALLHANPNSRVGRIAIFRDAVLATQTIEAERDAAQALLDLMEVPTRSAADVAVALADAVLNDATAEELAALEAELDAAVDYEAAATGVDELNDELLLRPAVERSLLEAAANKVVTDEVEAEVERLLGLY